MRRDVPGLVLAGAVFFIAAPRCLVSTPTVEMAVVRPIKAHARHSMNFILMVDELVRLPVEPSLEDVACAAT